MLELKRDWKAIFTDIDGTLLNSAREVSAKTREALRCCAREGLVLGDAYSARLMEKIDYPFGKFISGSLMSRVGPKFFIRYEI